MSLETHSCILRASRITNLMVQDSLSSCGIILCKYIPQLMCRSALCGPRVNGLLTTLLASFEPEVKSSAGSKYSNPPRVHVTIWEYTWALQGLLLPCFGVHVYTTMVWTLWESFKSLGQLSIKTTTPVNEALGFGDFWKTRSLHFTPNSF